MTHPWLGVARVDPAGPVAVVKRVAHVREVARQEIFDRLAHEFTDARRACLDKLLAVDTEIGMTPAAMARERARCEMR